MLTVVAQSDALTHDALTALRRLGDYRVIAKIEDETATVFVIAVGHRREVYR